MKTEVKKLLVEKAIEVVKTEQPNISNEDLRKVFSCAYQTVSKLTKQ
mgnify:CR=1 FL=1